MDYAGKAATVEKRKEYLIAIVNVLKKLSHGHLNLLIHLQKIEQKKNASN